MLRSLARHVAKVKFKRSGMTRIFKKSHAARSPKQTIIFDRAGRTEFNRRSWFASNWRKA